MISGKDSSAGSTHTDEGIVSVPPAVFLSGLGKVPDHRTLLPEAWTGAGGLLVRVGPATPSPAGTVAARALGRVERDLVGDPAVEAERFLSALRAGHGLLRSGTRIEAGGVAARLVMGALASGLGVELDPPAAGLEALFAEHRLAALVEIDPADLASLPAELNPVVVGRLTSDGGIIADGTELLTPAVRDAWTNAFSELLG